MGLNTVKYLGEETTGPSNAVWSDCPLSEINEGLGIGFGFYDDFLNHWASGTITSVAIKEGRPSYNMFGGSSGTIAFDEATGLVFTQTDNNQGMGIETVNKPFRLTSLGANFWFEARIKISSIVTNEQSFFVGLFETATQTASIPLTATGALADENLVGFHFPEANTTAFDFSYKADTVTAVEVNSDIGTLAEGTYIKLGFKVITGILSCYVNGVKQATSKTLPNATGTDFPADVDLGPNMSIQSGVDTNETMTIDWFQCYQLRAEATQSVASQPGVPS